MSSLPQSNTPLRQFMFRPASHRLQMQSDREYLQADAAWQIVGYCDIMLQANSIAISFQVYIKSINVLFFICPQSIKVIFLAVAFSTHVSHTFLQLQHEPLWDSGCNKCVAASLLKCQLDQWCPQKRWCCHLFLYQVCERQVKMAALIPPNLLTCFIIMGSILRRSVGPEISAKNCQNSC